MRIEHNDHGLSLVETLMAVTLAAAGVFSVGAVAFVATTTTKNQGSETTRATIYAQDKIEALTALAAGTAGTTSWADCTQTTATQASTYTACNTSGITGGTATGWYTGLLAGGQIGPYQTACPASTATSYGYMDFLDVYGNQIAGTSCSAVYTSTTKVGYVREWSITDANTFGSTPALKQISVAVYSLAYIQTVGQQPVVVVTMYLSNPN